MNVFYESIYDLIDELLSLNHFSVEKMHDFDVFNECVTNRPTDTAYYRDARTHLNKAGYTGQDGAPGVINS